MNHVEIRIVEPTNQDLILLISKLDKELLERYPVNNIFGVDFCSPKINDITFAIAYLDSMPVGCGALRPIDKESIELKRFFVDPSFRKKGIATKLLVFLETKAKSLGFKIIRLETGIKQLEAIQLYKKFGFYQIECFGDYVGAKMSVCLEKKVI